MALLAAPLFWLALAAAADAPMVVPPAPPPGGTRGLVIVLSAPASDELIRTTLARVLGELTAARFRVSMMPLAPESDPTLAVETVAPESGAVAAFAITHNVTPTGDSIAVWVCDRLGERTTIQRMPVRGDSVSQEAEVLALQSIELIRASIAGLWSSPPSPAPSPSPSERDRSGRGGARFTLGAGAAMLADAGLPGPEWLLCLRATARWPSGFGMRVDVGGLGPALTVSEAAGGARVNRQLVVAGPLWVLHAGERLTLTLTMAFGAAHVGAQGETASPDRQTHAAGTWSALGLAGLAGSVHLGGPVGAFLAADAAWSWPAVNLDIAGARTDPFARPGALLSAGLHVEL